MRKLSISKSGTNNVDIVPIVLGGVAPPVVTASKYWVAAKASDISPVGSPPSASCSKPKLAASPSIKVLKPGSCNTTAAGENGCP